MLRRAVNFPGWRRSSALVLFTAFCSAVQPQRPRPHAQTTLRAWGDDSMRDVLARWQSAFRVRHPEARFEDTLLGSGSGMAGIITGKAEFAVMGRPASANEVMGFEWVHRYKPRGIAVLTGSLDQAGASPALVVFVHRTNPVRRLTLEQLARMFGCCGQGSRITKWGQLGAGGAWRGRTIRAYLYNNETGSGDFVEKALLGNGDKWDWTRVKEFGDFRRPSSIEQMDERIMTAFARDPYGIAISTLHYAGPDARAVAIARTANGPFVSPDRSTVECGTYPLTRRIYIYVDAPPGKAMNPLVRAFLAYVLDPAEQAQAAAQGRFLPLPESLAQSEMQELSQ